MGDDQRREQERLVGSLLDALEHDRDPSVRAEAALELGKIKDDDYLISEALSVLQTYAVRDQSVGVRRACVSTLGELENQQALSTLYVALQEREPSVREVAALALGRIRSAAAIPALCEALDDRNKDVRVGAAWALGQIKHRATAIPSLAEKAFDEQEDIEVRQSAIKSLGSLGYMNAVPFLLDLLCDDYVSISSEAALALKNMKGLKKALAKYVDAPKFSKLRKALRANSDSNVLCTLAIIMGYVQNPITIPDLQRTLYRSDDITVCEALADALVCFGYDAERNMIDALLNGPTAAARQAVASRLRHFDTDDVVDALALALDDSYREVRRSAWASLKSINTPRSRDIRSQQSLMKKLFRFF